MMRGACNEFVNLCSHYQAQRSAIPACSLLRYLDDVTTELLYPSCHVIP